MSREAFLAGILGTPYDPAKWHCWWLAGLVQREMFGRALPAGPAPLPRLPERAALLAAHPARAAWREVETPADGDLVLMGKAPGRDVHCGVYLVEGGGRVLHTAEGHGAVLDTPLELRAAQGWRLSFHRPI